MNNFKLPKYNLSSKLHFALGIMLILAIMPMPYGYYTFLRIAVCGFAGVSAYYNFKSDGGDKSFWSWFYLVVAILFNPFAIVAMSVGVWIMVDIILAVVFCVLAYKVRDLENK